MAPAIQTPLRRGFYLPRIICIPYLFGILTVTPTRTRKAHCNDCGGERNHHVLHVERLTWDNEDRAGIHGGTDYETLKCAGCEKIVLRESAWCTEDGDDGPTVRFYPPSTFRPEPKWLHDFWLEFPPGQDLLHDLLKEVYVALQNDQPFLAAMGIRALLEQIMVTKCGDHGTFRENLAAFEDKGFVSALQRERLETVLEVGHAAIHRGYKPSMEDLMTLVDLTEVIVQTIYLHGSKVEDLKKKIPARKKSGP